MKQKSRNWSVILLMCIGILFVTVAGSIFVSSTWKMLTETAKEICLCAITIGIFIGSYILRKRDGFAITGKALYYLGIAATGFTAYMLSASFEDSFNSEYFEFSAIRVSFAVLLMLAETAYIYIKGRSIIDIVASYVLLGSLIFTSCIGFGLSYRFQLMIYVIEVLLLAANYAVVSIHENANVATKNCCTVLFIISLVIETASLVIYSLGQYFIDGTFGFITMAAVILLASALIVYLVNKDTLSRFLVSFYTALALAVFSTDMYANLDVIPNYYHQDFMAILVAIFIVITKVIWKNAGKDKDAIDGLTYTLALLTGLSLLTHNVQTQEIACVLTLGVIFASVLLWSIIVNDKKYQILSGIILGLMAIYLTRTFWLSIAWWVYLLVVGIGCIVIAIIKEKHVALDEQYEETFTAKVEDIHVPDVELDFVRNENGQI